MSLLRGEPSHPRRKLELEPSSPARSVCFRIPTGAKPPSADCLLCLSFRACNFGAGLGVEHGQEAHPSPRNGMFAVRNKFTELAIATRKNTMRQETARSDRSRYVGASQTRLHHVHDQNFKPAAPTSGDKIMAKRRFSPLVACVSGVKTDAGSFNRRQHMG
jgi:hypothetical protein